MPRLSAFYGLIITMYYQDHAPPHFHVRYGEYEAQVRIDSLEMLNGDLPRRALRLAQTWARLHQEELALSWDRALRQEPLGTIDPLD